MRSIQEVESYVPKKVLPQYKGPTWYNVGDKKYEVAPWNHPASLANTILQWIVHTFFYGVYIVAPMGHGKTTIANTIAHFIHLKDPRFRIVWAGAHEFTHQETFFNSLPKRTPHLIIFDDISGALKQLGEKQIEANFSTLTIVRDIIDPGVKRTPVICIVVGHYSKNLEKEFRAQLGMSIYAALGNEERTNLDSIAEKGSDARRALDHFGDLYGPMFKRHEFTLYMGNGRPMKYITDHPFRAACAISKTDGSIFLFTDKDVCEKCVKKKFRRFVKPEIVLDEVITAYGKYGEQALRDSLFDRGYVTAINRDLAGAKNFVSQRIDPVYDYDPQEMIELIYARKHKKVPVRPYNKNKINNAILTKLEKNSEVREVPVTPLGNIETKETKPENPDIVVTGNGLDGEITEDNENQDDPEE